MSDTPQRKPKDNWDRLSALSGLLSAVSALIIAGVGGYFTSVYRELDDARRADDLAARAAQEAHQNRIREMQALANFLPYLTRGDEAQKQAAIVIIGWSARPEIATELTAVFESPGTRAGADFLSASVSATQATPPPASAARPDGGPERWIYLGEYDKAAGEWKKQYLSFDAKEPPRALEGQTPAVSRQTGALYVRDRPLGEIVGDKQAGATVKICETRDFANLGYIWGRISCE